MDATEDFHQIKLRFVDSTQYSYELIRPVVLFASPVAGRSIATNVDRTTIREKATRFLEEGMLGLVDKRPAASGRKGHQFPGPVAGHLLYCKKIWPAINAGELVRIVWKKFGYRTNHHTITAFLERNPIPVQLELKFKAFREYEDHFEARLAVIKMHKEGWNQTSIAGVLRMSPTHVRHLISAFKKDGLAAIEDDHRTRPAQHPENQLTFAFLQETLEVQKEYPRAGAYRIKAILERKRAEAGNPEPVPSNRTMSRALVINRLFMGAPEPWPPPPTPTPLHETGSLPYDPIYRHQYWFIDVRYLVQLDEHWVYSIAILEGYSRCFLAGMASIYQDELAILQLVHAAVAEHGCPEGMVSDNGGAFIGAAYKKMLGDLGIAYCPIDRGEPWQNLIEAQFKVQLRLADAKFEQAENLSEIEARHAEFIRTFNTTAHWAHRERADGLRTPEDVLAGARGLPIDPARLAECFKGMHFERTISLHGRIRIQRFSLYAERGLSRHRVSVWLHEGWLRIEYGQTLLAQYQFRTDRQRQALKSVFGPRLYATAFASPQIEIFELDDEQWPKALQMPAPAPRKRRLITLARQLSLWVGWNPQPTSLAEALFGSIQRDE